MDMLDDQIQLIMIKRSIRRDRQHPNGFKTSFLNHADQTRLDLADTGQKQVMAKHTIEKAAEQLKAILFTR